MIRDLIISNRSCRRFHQEFAIERRTLEELVELARYSASAANLQPLKYILSCEPAKNARIFATLAWAGYLRDWPGPAEGERPSAYVVILGDTEINNTFGCDHGIAAQSILLGAREQGLAGCMIGLIQREELAQDPGYPAPLRDPARHRAGQAEGDRWWSTTSARTETSSTGATATASTTCPSGPSMS